MKKIFLFASALIIATTGTLFSSCNNEQAKTADAPAFSLDSAKAAIAASNSVYGSCFATGDSVKFTGCYTADACIYPPNMPKLCGPQAISAFFNGAVKMGIRNLKLNTEEVIGGASAVAETGNYEVLGDKDASLEKGKFIVIWKMENGKWKMYRDVWNSDTPPPPASPAEKK